MSERRRSNRQKSLYRGVVYFDDSPIASECTIRDISETGARLKFSTPLMADINKFQLEVPLKGLKFKCDIVWRADTEVGVSFISANLPDEKQDGSAIERRVNELETNLAELKHLVDHLLQRDAPASVQLDKVVVTVKNSGNLG